MRLKVSLLLAGFLAVSAVARSQQPAQQRYPAGPDISQQALSLADQPATHTGITFDRSELQIMQNLLESNGMDPKRAGAALTGVAFDSYHYQQPAFYTPEAMASLMEGYRLAGWKHLVNGNASPGNSAQPKAMITDLWLHFSGADIDALTVLTRASRQMNVVRITGDLKPLDLLKLSGHFGIPKVDPSAVMVPAR